MAQMAFRIYMDSNLPSVRTGLRGLRDDIDMTDVARIGAEAMQKGQQSTAPVGSGPGVHGRIPRSIETSVKSTDNRGSAEGVSRTRLDIATYTNLGTGLHGPKHSEYFIPRPDWGEGRGIWHPGIRGTHWFERGANLGAPVALAAFRAKVTEMLALRGID
jgi:hypothetical protein